MQEVEIVKGPLIQPVTVQAAFVKPAGRQIERRQVGRDIAVNIFPMVIESVWAIRTFPVDDNGVPAPFAQGPGEVIKVVIAVVEKKYIPLLFFGSPPGFAADA